MDRDDEVLLAIRSLAAEFDVDRVVLFGSRARGGQQETSDYDIAVYAATMGSEAKARLALAVEDVPTLRKIDLVFTDDCADPSFLARIEREGVTIYDRQQHKAR